MAVGMAGSWKLDICRSTTAGPLAELRVGFAAELERQGYSPATAGPYLRRFAQLSCWMQAEGLGVSEFSPEVLERFGAACRAAGYRDHVSIRGDKPMLAYLRMVGLCAAEPLLVAGPVDELLARFAGWLVQDRHLAPSSVVSYVWHARALVKRLAVEDRIELGRLDAAFVRRFVLDTCPQQGRAMSKATVVAIRQLLAFLYLEELIGSSLVEAVPSVAGARLSGLPKRLGRGEVQRILDACDRDTVVGQRNFAIVLLLARLGLRAGEAAGLLLDDIDWRSGEIVVRGKGRAHRLPLPDAVGEAIVAYLRDGRPATAHTRSLFVTVLPPLRAMGRGAVGDAVARTACVAGLGRVNAHRLRHTLASEMLAGGADLPAIGQVLGHRMLEATAIYSKCDRETLRQIARPWPGATA
jgi:site-specific recombinase XerD